MGDYDDLAKLPSIDPSVVMDTLKARHAKDGIYTKNGAVLVAINPYKPISLYSDNHLKQYKSSMSLESEPPHIFAVAAATHRAMVTESTNQAVVISGESGAGKTESARFVLQYLRFVTNATEDLEMRIHTSQPLTEAFGCAKTMRNDNSSRFGKFLKLYFDQSAKIQGAALSTYLLEKSRVTHIGPGERAYHIFYNLLRGLPTAERKKLHLDGDKMTDYKYLALGDQNPAKHDVKGYTEVVESFGHQGVDADEQQQYWQLIAGILLLGNVQFDDSKPDAATIKSGSMPSLTSCEKVLGLHSGTMLKALSKRKIKAGAEMVEQDLTLEKANDGRDALSKAIYSRLFDYLIEKINAALVAGGAPVSADQRIIGIVDIFGFEVFKVNSLEQLCINFANEKLQALFTKSVFEETLKAYKQDGISADEITYVDNKHLIELFDAPKIGLWGLLSEECMVPKGSDSGFAEKLHDAQKKGSALQAVKGLARSHGFQLGHFAGQVTYSTAAWLDKNKDPLGGDLVVLMQFADNQCLSTLFTEEQVAPGGKQKIKSNKFKGVVDTFRTQLNELYNVLDASQLHFVRCFKPNDAKAADTWSDETVSRQLHTSGVLDALRVARTGYPDRLAFGEFANTFADVAGLKKASMGGKEKCQAVLDTLEIPKTKYQLGNTRVFLALGILDMLKTKRTERMAKVCVKLQAAARGMAARKLARKTREARAVATKEMEAAMATEDVELLKAKIKAAEAAGVSISPKGKVATEAAKKRLTDLEQMLAARKAAGAALETAMNGFDINTLRTAIQAATQMKVDAELISRAGSRLDKLEEEERQRIEEEKRLATLAVEAKLAEEKRLAEERKKREEEEGKRRIAEEKDLLAAQEAAKLKTQQDAANAVAAAERAAIEEVEARERQAIEEEEKLRAEVLAEVTRRTIQFRSEPADVLEYAVYLGMELKDDLELLWIADEALQADDPEGWDQAESPNGDTYYIHAVTAQVLWQHPLDYTYQQKYLSFKSGGNGEGIDISSPPPAPAPSRAGPAEVQSSPPASGGAASAPPAAPPASLASDDQLRTRLQHLLGTKHTDLRAMLLEPATTDTPVQCYVLRHKSRIGGTRFDFFMSLSSTKDMYCFTGKKTSSSRSSSYTIALDQDEGKKTKSDSSIGKVRADRKAMEYTLFDNGAAPGEKADKSSKEPKDVRRELMHVHFINSLRNRNPGAMHVGVPTVDKEGTAALFRPSTDKDGLEERLKADKLSDMEVFKNREPKWNHESQMYQLDFRGRATHASCKNIQLTKKDGDQNDAQLLMGKVDDNKFNVDFQYPFSALQAFAFALVVFDNSSSSMTL